MVGADLVAAFRGEQPPRRRVLLRGPLGEPVASRVSLSINALVAVVASRVHEVPSDVLDRAA